MSILRDIVRQYWANLLATGVFVCAAVRYCSLNDAFDLNLHLRWIALAFGGLVMFIASEEFSEWSGRYGLSRQHWLMTPSGYIRLLAASCWSASRSRCIACERAAASALSRHASAQGRGFSCRRGLQNLLGPATTEEYDVVI